MKTILKAIAVIICAALLIWNASQLKAIEAGTKEVPIEYGKYVAEDTVGEYREATILGLIPFAVEENQQKYGTQIMNSTVVAYYCLAVLEDFSMGAVKLDAVNEELVGYDEWIIETEEDYLNVLLSEGFTIRGETMTMPHFDSDTISAIMDGSYDFDEMWQEEQEFNNSLDGITLLDTTGYYPDVKTVVPDLSTLNGNEGFVIAILVIAALMLAWDLLKIFAEKSAEKKSREAATQQPQNIPTPNNGTTNGNQGADLIREYTRVLMECSSAPVGDPTQAAEYAMGKLNYFRNKGLPEKDLYHLEISICTNIPDYVAANYAKVMSAFKNDATPFWAATENLIKKGKMDKAYAISKPFVEYIEQNQNTLVNGKHCFQSFIEDCLYRTENGFTMQTPIDTTPGYYVGLLVSYAKLLQQMSMTKPELKGTSTKYLELAKKLSNVNTGLYLVAAQGINQDGQQWKENIDKALRFCHEKDDLYGLAQIYYHMGVHYMAHEQDRLSAACLTVALHYANPETANLCRYILSKTSVGTSLDKQEAISLLQENGIQVGYSAPVRDIAEALSPNPNAQELIKHILQDSILAASFGKPVANVVIDDGQTEMLSNARLIRLKNSEEIPLTKAVFRIGKERTYVDYCIADNNAVSRAHAVISNRDGDYYVEDTNSKNHTYVNNLMIQPGVEVKLEHGTKLRFANEEFEFRLH